jgi:hypothetical protein
VGGCLEDEKCPVPEMNIKYGTIYYDLGMAGRDNTFEYRS